MSTVRSSLPPLGIIVFAYGLTENEPNRVNRQLAEQAMKIRDSIMQLQGRNVLVAAQWENSLAMDRVDLTVGPYLDRYLGSNDDVREAREKLFLPNGVSEVIPVAQPFLHLAATRAHVKRAGFEPVNRGIKPVGHVPESLQWWTRSAHRLGVYAAMQRTTGYSGPLIVTDQMRRLARH